MSYSILRQFRIAFLVLAAVASAMPAAAQLNFYTVAPCRVQNATGSPLAMWDPTDPDPQHKVDATYTVDVAGVVVPACGALPPVPPDAVAVAINVTIVGASKAGYLQVFPAGTILPPPPSPPPPPGAIQFSAGLTKATFQEVPLGGGDLSFLATMLSPPPPPGTYHIAIDVFGYFLNKPPVLTVGGTLSYTEDDPPTAIDTTITVTDPDDTNLQSATVQVTGNYVNGEDVLSFVDTASITGVFAAATGTLTLTGSDTLANWQTALRSVLYENTSDNPSTLQRTVTWIASDGASTSAPVTSTINVTATNDAPVLTAGGVLSYTEGAPPTAIDTTVTVADPDNTNLQSATAQITGNYSNGEDVLSFVDTASITGVFAAATGTLTLTGSDTLANWQTALRSVLYENTSDNPSTLQRTVTWIGNDGSLPSAPVTSTINLSEFNNPPTIDPIPDPAPINEDAGIQTVNLTGITAGGGETQPLQVTAVSDNLSVIPNPTVSYTSPNTTGSLQYTPVAGASGTANVTVTVTDGGLDGNLGTPGDNASTTETFQVVVNDFNDPPTIDPIPDPAPINEDAGAQTVNLSGITAGDGETQPLQVTAVSDNTSVIPNPTVTYTSPNATGSLQYTPVASAFGTANITVTVTDGGLDGNLGTAGDNATTTEVFQVVVNEVNDPPTIDPVPDPAAINEDAGLQTVNLSGITAGDGETQPLQVTAVSDNTSVIPNPTVIYTSPNATGSLQYTPVANAFGTANITVTVTDGGLDGNLGTPGDNAATTDVFQVVVNAVNDTPTLDPIPDPAAINEDAGLQTVNLSGISAGPGEGTQPLQVTAVSDNTSVIPNPTAIYTSPNATGSLQYTPVANASGTANITVTVTDGGLDGNLGTPGDNATTTDVFQVVVNAVNDTPTLDPIPDPAAINEDAGLQTVNLSGISAGPGEGTQPLQVTAVSDNTSVIPNPTVIYTSPNATGSLQYTPVANAFGTANITVTVTDGGIDGNIGTPGDNATTTDIFQVVVNSVNDQPTITAIADQVIDEDTSTGALAFTIGDIETMAASLTVGGSSSNTTLIPNGNIVFGGSGANRTVTVTPAANQFGGPVTITVTVDDGSGAPNATVVETFLVTVNAVNDPPLAVDDIFDAIGNTELRVDLAAPGVTPHALETTGGAPFGVLDGSPLPDRDPVENDAITLTGIFGCGDLSAPFGDSPVCNTANGGTVVLQADGSFSYVPPAGHAGASDSFQYTIQDNGVPAPASDTGLVTINRLERIWYVDPNAAGGGNGTSVLPFNTLDALDGAGGAGDSDVISDYIFVHDGSLALSAAMEMEANQHLIGQGNVNTGPAAGFALSIPVNLNGNGTPTNLVATGTHPELTNASGNTVTVGNAIPVEIVGLSLAGGTIAGGGACGGPTFACNAIDLTSTVGLTGSGTLTIADNEIRGAGAEGIDVNLNVGTTGTLALNVALNSWDIAGIHTGNGVDINRLAGTLNLDVSGNTNVVSSATAVLINGGVVGGITITGFSNNTIHGNTGGTGMQISNVTFDPVGAPTVVNAGNLPIGALGNPVGGSGLLVLTSQGGLSFADLDVFSATNTGVGISGSGAASSLSVTATGGTNTIDEDSGTALLVNTATINLVFDDLDSNISAVSTSVPGVSLTNVAGTFTADSDASISKTGLGSAAFLVDNSTAGTTVLASSFGGPISNSSGSGRSVSINNADSGSAISFTGQVTDSPGQGVSLTTNTGATISFSGGLTLSTGANTGFNATGGGTVTVIDPAGLANNTITTAGGTALNVISTTIGASGLTFESISAGTSGSPANGIVLNNTGTTAGLTVTGTGSSDGTGGTIKNTSGDGIVLTSTRLPNLKNMIIGDAAAVAGQTPNATNNIGGNGIAMNGADDVTLDNLKIARTATHGIDGTGVTNLTISNSEILNAGDSNEDSGLDFSDLNQNNLDGTVQITNTVIDAFTEDGIFVENFSGTLNMTVSGSTFANSTNTLCGGSTCGENGIQIRGDGTAQYTLSVNGSSQFNTVDGNGILAVAEGTAATPSVVNVSSTTFTNTKALGIVLFGGTGDATSTIESKMNFTIGPSVSLTGTTSTAISVQPNGKSTMRGTVTAAVNGSTLGRGIEVLSDDASTGVVSITNSTVSNTAFNGIFASNQNVGKLDIHIRNNNVSAPLDTVPPSGLAVHGTEINVRETSVNCLDIASNQSAGNGTSGGAGYRTRQRDTSTFRLERFTGSGSNTTVVQNFLVAQNTSGTASSTVSTTYTGVVDGFCEDP